MRCILLAATLLMASSAHAQVIEIHIHVHLDAGGVGAKGEDVGYLGQVLDSAVMMTLDDDARLKAKLPPIKARVHAVKPRTPHERRAIDALKARIRRYERYEPSEPADDDNDDMAGVAAG